MSKKPSPLPTQPKFQGHIINEKGDEIPITDEMVTDSMADIKLQSIGVHTGFTKVISDEMLPDSEQ